MRKTMPWMSLLIILTLVGCGYLGAKPQPQKSLATPTLSADQMQTQISQMLTQMPTSTGAPQGAVSPTAALPTVIVDTNTPTQKAAEPVLTATTAPQAASTNTPKAAAPAATKVPPTSAAPTATATTAPTSGPTATLVPGDPASTLGKPDGTDTMKDARAWNWPTGWDEFTRATFGNNGQSVKALTTKDGWRLANPLGRDFTNLYLEATFDSRSCEQGNAYEADHYGLMVRVPVLEDPTQGYLFGINCNGQYSLRSWDWNMKEPPKKEMGTLIDWTNSKFINAGQNKINRIGIMLQGTRMTLYANGHKLGQTYDYENHNVLQLPLSGYFGVFVGSRTGNGYTVLVKSISYWENP